MTKTDNDSKAFAPVSRLMMYFETGSVRAAFSLILSCCALALLPVQLQALPEDANQPIRGTYDNSLLLLDEGRQIFYGTPGTPAEIIQGTLKISGQEITIERAGGEVKKVTVIGSPARYQQQPAVDQTIVTAEGDTITLDYDAQHMSAVGQVKFIQGSDQLTGCQVDYYLESRRVTTPQCPDGSQAEFILAPGNGQ